MTMAPDASRGERLHEFFRRLAEAPPASDHDEAMKQVSDILNRSLIMNPIERLRDELLKRFPGIVCELDAPADRAGLWQLDVRPGGNSPWIVVEWKPTLEFGVSTPGAHDYGTKPDELYANAKAACDRVAQLLESGGRTEPPAGVHLAVLRQIRKLSQAEVASRAGVKQAAIARIEGRDDILLSTLGRVISAMGGRLLIRAEFTDGTSRDLSRLVSSTRKARNAAMKRETSEK